MTNDINYVLINKEQIEQKVSELGSQISRDYKGKNLLLLGLLKGAVVFMSDLMRSITIPAAIEFMAVSSYGSSTKTTGVVKVIKDISIDISDYHVLVVEDILDSGMTLSYILEWVAAKNPKSIKLCTLLNKPDRRVKEVSVDYEGYVIPDEFVVGYGLDYNEKYRNLSYIGVLKPEVYAGEQ
jgi:hypoxanthine phosphoribosyltransferase